MKNLAKKTLLTIFSLCISFGMLWADGKDPKQETSKVVKITGQVVDQLTGETLAGVKISINETNEIIYTDFDGEFQVQCDLSQKPEISASMISYEGKSIRVEGIDKLKISLERQK